MNKRLLSIPIAACLLTTAALPGCKSHHAHTTPDTLEWVQLNPGLRIDRATRTVELDARVALDCHNPATPDVYLELIACSPDTREHESLVVTDVRPALIHAALLAVGLTPGTPADLAHETPPSGDTLSITLIENHSAKARRSDPTSWITDAPTRSRSPHLRFVFAGSRPGNQGIAYDADGTGVIIGLATFGSEVIAPRTIINPAADIEQPVWIADPRATPPINTPVRVRITPSP